MGLCCAPCHGFVMDESYFHETFRRESMACSTTGGSVVGTDKPTRCVESGCAIRHAALRIHRRRNGVGTADISSARDRLRDRPSARRCRRRPPLRHRDGMARESASRPRFAALVVDDQGVRLARLRASDLADIALDARTPAAQHRRAQLAAQIGGGNAQELTQRGVAKQDLARGDATNMGSGQESTRASHRSARGEDGTPMASSAAPPHLGHDVAQSKGGTRRRYPAADQAPCPARAVLRLPGWDGRACGCDRRADLAGPAGGGGGRR